jgi:hypothetical protein
MPTHSAATSPLELPVYELRLQIHQMVATAMDSAAEIWNEEIDHPTCIAELDQEAMELRSECARAAVPLTVVA